jgi:hypothetical protein
VRVTRYDCAGEVALRRGADSRALINRSMRVFRLGPGADGGILVERGGSSRRSRMVSPRVVSSCLCDLDRLLVGVHDMDPGLLNPEASDHDKRLFDECKWFHAQEISQTKENSPEKRHQCLTLNHRTRKHAPAQATTTMSRIKRLVPNMSGIPTLPLSNTHSVILRILRLCPARISTRACPQHDPLGWDADSGSPAV